MNYRFLCLAFCVLFLSINFLHAQQYEEYQLRLEPVWSRVADALGEPGSVESAEFSPNGKYIVSGTKYDNSVIMWRTSDGQELWRKYAAEEVERVGFSADNQYVAACSEDFKITVYEAATGDIEKVIELKVAVDGLTWAHGRNVLAIGEEKNDREGDVGGIIRLYQMPDWEEVQTLDFGGTVNELFFSSDDQYLLATGHGGFKVFDLTEGKVAHAYRPKDYDIFVTGVFSPDAHHVFAADRKGNMHLVDWKNDKIRKIFNHTGKKIESVSWHPNGDYLTCVGHDSYIRVYRVSDVMTYKNDRIRVAHKSWAGDHAEYMDFNADGSFLVSAHQNGLIKLWAWMGEDPNLNDKRHRKVSSTQSDAKMKN
ncbi:MAG: hypothetical protein AAGI23_19280 [Bacteroidota bacterium]